MLKDSSTITNYEAFYIKNNIRGQEPLNLKTTRLNVRVISTNNQLIILNTCLCIIKGSTSNYISTLNVRYAMRSGSKGSLIYKTGIIITSTQLQ